MTGRWIWLVPSKIWMTFASRMQPLDREILREPVAAEDLDRLHRHLDRRLGREHLAIAACVAATAAPR